MKYKVISFALLVLGVHHLEKRSRRSRLLGVLHYCILVSDYRSIHSRRG
jgi:hypothetical protein